MKIQIATEYVLQTYNPPKNEMNFGYSVTKTVINDSISYSVDCFSGSAMARSISSRNAKILSHYIQTGEIREELVIK